MVTVLSHKRLTKMTKMIQTIRLHLSYKYWYSILRKSKLSGYTWVTSTGTQFYEKTHCKCFKVQHSCSLQSWLLASGL